MTYIFERVKGVLEVLFRSIMTLSFRFDKVFYVIFLAETFEVTIKQQVL